MVAPLVVELLVRVWRNTLNPWKMLLRNYDLSMAWRSLIDAYKVGVAGSAKLQMRFLRQYTHSLTPQRAFRLQRQI